MKKKHIIIGSILVIGAIALGSTLAWWTWNTSSNEQTNVVVTVGGITINYEDGENITNNNLIPTSTKEKGISKNITVSSTGQVYLDLNMAVVTLDDGLKDASFKYEIYNGTTLVTGGNFANSNVGDNIALLNRVEVNSTPITYTLYIWIDGNMDNPNTMYNQDFAFRLNASATDEKPIDTSGANEPKLVDNMIPVMYNGENWVKADSSNTNNTYKWYAYQDKQWANAVLVSSTNRSNYLSSEVGTVINEDDILAYYVWIPRYKYKVWNINKEIGVDSYNARTTGIDIVFEEGIESTGDIICNEYDFSITEGNGLNEVCSGSNGGYYTHPAFTFGDTQVTGMWVGKFEVSNSTSQIQTKPNVSSLRSQTVDSFYSAIKSMQNSGNAYGLSSDTSKVDSHMLKNMEWGAVAYLTNSDYGRCTNGSCTEIGINNNENYTTGCGASAESDVDSVCNAYNTTTGMLASTTENIYGIYDMSGGAWEHVMGNNSSGSGSYIYNKSSAGSNFSYSSTTAKYIDTYAYGTSFGDQTANNRARLGDATGEVASSSYTAWYGDYAIFVGSGIPWFIRGGDCSFGSKAGVFGFYFDDGDAGHSARAALLAL